tara:strand:- start:598 stop:1842 length:1245 start_codon:yes stop_codon:yes gene_type:complete
MATFEAQVEGLTSLSIDGSSAPTQTELTQFLTDGAKEILTSLPDSKKRLFTTSNELNGSSTNYTVAGSEVFAVTRDDGTINQPCRAIPAELQGRIRDSDDMMAATTTDPAYYIANNLLSVVPEPSNSQNAHVQALAYPAVAFGDSAIAKFPDEAEYLVPVYAAIKSLQNALAAKSGNSDITGALTALEASVLNAEDEIEDAGKMVANIVLGVDEVTESAVDTDTTSSEFKTAADAITTALDQINTHNFNDEDTFTTASSQLTRVKNALDQVSDIINGNQPSATTDAFGAQAAEDIELVGSSLNIAQTEIQRANAHLSEWTSILQGAISQAQGFANEVQARGVWTSAKAQVWNGYFASAGAYAQAAQTYLASAQGYASEVQARLNVLSTEYSWMEKQQAKLQLDYDKGIQIVRGG